MVEVSTNVGSIADGTEADDAGDGSGCGVCAAPKATRRDAFLAKMDKVVPWSALCALIEPHYPKAREDGAGRRPIGLERMLRIHFLQQWYALSELGREAAPRGSRRSGSSFTRETDWTSFAAETVRTFPCNGGNLRNLICGAQLSPGICGANCAGRRDQPFNIFLAEQQIQNLATLGYEFCEIASS